MTLDDFANSTFPPREQRSEAAQHRYELLRASAHSARVFYDADQPLNTQDRTALAEVFATQKLLQKGTITALILAGFVLPGVARRALRVWRPRWWHTGVAALATLGGSYGATEYFCREYRWNWTLRAAQNAQYERVVRALHGIPASVGKAYYEQTARDPARVFPEPGTVDWNRSRGFPLELATRYGQ